MIDFISHFGFRQLPFTRELTVKEQFTHPQFAETRSALLQTIDNRMSAALIAPAGTGKTSVLRGVVAGLPEARYRVTYVMIANLSRREMAREMATALGLPPAGSYPMLVRRLQENFKSSLESDARRPVLFIDDAHEMRPDVLGMLRILTNFEMDSRLVVSIVLSGQPNLRELLRRDDLEDVARRLSHVATLSPLSRPDITTYLKHRAHAAGAKTLPLDAEAIEAIFELARGNLRATDALTLKALQLAHLKGAKVVDTNHVTEARGMLWA